MQNFKLNDEFRDKLLESAAWDKCGINLSESKAQEAEETQEPLEEDDDEEHDLHVTVHHHPGDLRHRVPLVPQGNDEGSQIVHGTHEDGP